MKKTYRPLPNARIEEDIPHNGFIPMEEEMGYDEECDEAESVEPPTPRLSEILNLKGIDPVIIKVNPANPLVITMAGDNSCIEVISSKHVLGDILSTSVHGATSVVTALVKDGADLSVLSMIPSELLKISVVAVVSSPPSVIFTN